MERPPDSDKPNDNPSENAGNLDNAEESSAASNAQPHSQPQPQLVEQYDAAAIHKITARRRRRRGVRLLAICIALASVFASVIYILSDNLLYYRTPTQAMTDEDLRAGKAFRLGGLVKRGSVERGASNYLFAVSDGAAEMIVRYRGVLPDLFREGQGVVAEGSIGDDGVFQAEIVLAKHDENYKPPQNDTKGDVQNELPDPY